MNSTLGTSSTAAPQPQTQSGKSICDSPVRTRVARWRERWRRLQLHLDPATLALIDEAWAKTNMTRTHSRARRGNRLHAKVPYGHWETMTFIAALRHGRIDAPCVLEGPANGARFLAHVQHFLPPSLKPGDIVVMDKLSSHRGRAVRQAIRSVGAKLWFLPPYSPDLNPIEQVFAKLKTLLRKADARTVEETWKRIGQLRDRFTPPECANYIRNAGYGYT
jgi:transposase